MQFRVIEKDKLRKAHMYVPNTLIAGDPYNMHTYIHREGTTHNSIRCTYNIDVDWDLFQDTVLQVHADPMIGIMLQLYTVYCGEFWSRETTIDVYFVCIHINVDLIRCSPKQTVYGPQWKKTVEGVSQLWATFPKLSVPEHHVILNKK